MLLLALLLGDVALSVALWFSELTVDLEREHLELVQGRLDEANGAVRDLLRQNARLALLYVDLSAKFVTAMEREAAAAGDPIESQAAGRLVS